MSAAFDRDALLDAFDQIGRAAVLAGTKLQIAVYGGSALMLASNFRFATEDVDVSELERPLPDWLAAVVREIARENRLAGRLVQRWGRIPPQFARGSSAPIIWSLGHFRETVARRDLWFRFPSAEYLLALKLKAARSHGPASWRNGAAGYSQFDASGGHLDGRGSNSRAWPIFSGKRRFLREAAVFIEEHESRGRRSMRPNTLAEAVERI